MYARSTLRPIRPNPLIANVKLIFFAFPASYFFPHLIFLWLRLFLNMPLAGVLASEMGKTAWFITKKVKPILNKTLHALILGAIL
jgi:hypothetical protein